MSTEEIIENHRRRGRFFRAAGVQSFVLEEGRGEPVLCLHGFPMSSFLYRKVLPQLAQRGLRGIAFDYPGMGLADRPPDFDYTWTGLSRFVAAAVDALGLDRFHLIVHDIGGPIGFALAAGMPERIRSLTVLNTVSDAHRFVPYWMVRPFGMRGVGPLWLKLFSRPMFLYTLRRIGVLNPEASSADELAAHLRLFQRGDGGLALTRIVRGFELTHEAEAIHRKALTSPQYPVQLVWGAQDPILTLHEEGESLRRVAKLDQIHTVPARHYLQEEQAPAIASHVAHLAERARKAA